MKVVDNKDALIYFQNIGASLKDDIKLLKTYLGVCEFGYLKMFFDNKYFYVSSDTEMIDAYVKCVTSTAVFYGKTISANNGYLVLPWPKSPAHLWMDVYAKHEYYNGLTILHRNNNCIDLFWFSSKGDNNPAYDFYVSNGNVFLVFMQHWLGKNKKKSGLDAPKVLATFVDGADFSNIDKIELDKKAEEEHVKKFLKLIRLNGVDIHTLKGDVYLTRRESECLRLLSKGNTSKEVSSLLDISCRTVEEHVNNIRSKTGYLYKSDLVKLYQEQIVDFYN